MKLRTTLAVLLIVVTLVLSSLTYGGLELYKQETLQRNQASVDESASLAADQIATRVRERRDYIGYVASQPATANFSNAGVTIGGVVNNSRFFAAQVVAANGTVVAFGGQIDEAVRRETIGSDVSDEAYFSEAMTRSSYVSAPEAVPDRERYLVVISAPIITTEGLQGVFAASMYVSGETLLDPVAALDTQRQRVRVTASDTVLLDTGEQFEQALTGQARIDGVGWELTVERDRSQLNAQLQSLAIAQGIGLLLVLLAVVGFWVWEYRMNLRQTDRLLEGFSALLNGQQGHSVDLSVSEEWIQISEGFNELSAGLAAREAAVREREERLSVLNRILRHNLRNDMNVILGYADIIEARADESMVASAAATIQETGSDLADLGEKARWIDEGLDDTTTERGRIDVALLVDEVVCDLAASYPDASVTTTILPTGTATAFATPAIETAVRNLVENALEHNDAATPQVTVTVSAVESPGTGAEARLDVDAPVTWETDEIQITVVDNGPGISDYELQAVNEGNETALEHGSGVGLWLSRWLVDHSGGRLEFTENEPRGTVVTVALPRAAGGAT